MYASNFAGAFLAFRKWSSNIVLAACAAYVFAFGIHFIIHIDHVQMLPRAMMPLVILWFWRWLKNHKPRDLALAVFGLAVQFYCAIYLGFILLFAMAMIVFPYGLLRVRKVNHFLEKMRGRWWSTGLILLLAMMLVLPLALKYQYASKEVGGRSYEKVSRTLPKPQGYFFTHVAASNWRDLSLHGKDSMPIWWHQFHFVGIVPLLGLLLAILMLFKRNMNSRRDLIGLVIALLLSVLLLIEIGGSSLYVGIHTLPGFSSMRSMDRMVQAQILLVLFVGLSASTKVRVPRPVRILIGLALPADRSIGK